MKVAYEGCDAKFTADPKYHIFVTNPQLFNLIPVFVFPI